MAEVTAFVDDAVTGRLPDICAKDGVPATGRFRIVEEIGRSNRLGVLWLLLLTGPLGWIVLLFLASRDSGERLAVELPYSDAAYARFVGARRLRSGALAVCLLGTVGLLVLGASAHLGPAGIVLTLGLVAPAVVAVGVAEWRMHGASVDVALDASRRWVTLGRVHPAFVAACEEQTLEHRTVTSRWTARMPD
jgi:hypothetical protein